MVPWPKSPIIINLSTSLNGTSDIEITEKCLAAFSIRERLRVSAFGTLLKWVTILKTEKFSLAKNIKCHMIFKELQI